MESHCKNLIKYVEILSNNVRCKSQLLIVLISSIGKTSDG